MFAHVLSDNVTCSSSCVEQWLERQCLKKFESTSDDVPFFLEVVPAGQKVEKGEALLKLIADHYNHPSFL